MRKKTKSKPPPKSVTQFAPPLPDEVAVARRDLKPSRLINKAELLRRVPVTYPTLWLWMRQGNFPRSKNIGGKAAWLESEVEEWIHKRPNVPFKDVAEA
jgi:predicted DNA-binding transcriptional regulator AlpA